MLFSGTCMLAIHEFHLKSQLISSAWMKAWASFSLADYSLPWGCQSSFWVRNKCMLWRQRVEISDRQSLKDKFGNSKKDFLGPKSNKCCIVRQFYQTFILRMTWEEGLAKCTQSAWTNLTWLFDTCWRNEDQETGLWLSTGEFYSSVRRHKSTA